MFPKSAWEGAWSAQNCASRTSASRGIGGGQAQALGRRRLQLERRLATGLVEDGEGRPEKKRGEVEKDRGLTLSTLRCLAWPGRVGTEGNGSPESSAAAGEI